MSAVFLRKKQWWYIALSQLLAGFIGACMCYAVMVNYASLVWIGKSFYFLVSQNMHLEASCHTTRLDGGAGYLLDYEGVSYVAWSVYFNEVDGLTVQSGLASATHLLKLDVSYLSFKTRADKKKKTVALGALNSFYGCIDVLSQGIEMLDQGLTQQACARLLSLLSRTYTYMRETYRESYPQLSKACDGLQTALANMLTRTIYGKDLRYLLCSACDAYIRLTSVFTL